MSLVRIPSGKGLTLTFHSTEMVSQLFWSHESNVYVVSASGVTYKNESYWLLYGQKKEPLPDAEKIMDDKFNLAAYKGKPVSFRKWNGQLRQPVLLVTPRALVSVSPQMGFVHPRTELDTLGFDEPDTKCKLN